MCRFALYLGDEITISALVTDPEYSILHQSFHSHERSEPLNGDGFGIAWYPDHSAVPAVFKEVSPAWNSLNLRNLARVTRAHCVLAHVRAATPGLPVTQLNCHPFSWGPLTFMHNGHVGGFLRLKQRLVAEFQEQTFLEIQGSTDSEYMFGLVKEAWAAAPDDGLDRLTTALRAAVERVETMRRSAGIEEPSLLNLALCDGARAVVSRYTSDPREPANSLYLHVGRAYVCEDGVCRMVDPDIGTGALIVASEPLSPDPGWERVPENHLVTVDRDLRTEIVPV